MGTPEYLCGTQHIELPTGLRDSYRKLFSILRENYPQMELSRFFPLRGYEYDQDLQLSRATPFDNLIEFNEEALKKYLEPAVKLMVVGRSVNGWTELSEKDPRDFSASAAQVMAFCEGFSWLNNDGWGKEAYVRKHDGKKCVYNINRSAFFRTTRKVLKELKPATQYTERWFENIVWNNLYPIAPLHSGNAVGKLQDVQLEICKKLLCQQIDFYEPTHILFITDWDNWFARFSDIFPEVKKNVVSTTDYVVGYGTYNGAKIVVTIRPDRTRSNKPSEDMFAQAVVNCFDNIQLK